MENMDKFDGVKCKTGLQKEYHASVINMEHGICTQPLLKNVQLT